jgi:hypothetical protein
VKGLAGLKTRDVAAETLRRLARTYGLSGVEAVLRQLNWVSTPIR